MHRVLLVDDDPSVSTLYRLELEDDGFEVRTAANFTDATRIAKLWKPQCAIIDIKLGQESGPGLLRQLLELQPSMRTILLSAYPGYQDDFNTWLADAFVTKMSDTTELRQAVRQLLAGQVRTLGTQ